MQFLLIARPLEGVQMEAVMAHLRDEAALSWKYYTGGLLRSLHALADEPGVVFLFEAPDRAALDAALEEYPMRKAGLLKMEVLALKPYPGFEALFSDTAGSSK